MAELTDQEKEYFRIRAAVQEIFRVTDDDVDNDPPLRQMLHVMANLALIYRTKGAAECRLQNRAKMLEEAGIKMLKPKLKS